MLEARSAEARPRIRGEASLEARSAGAARARAAFDAAQLRRFASPSFVSLRSTFFTRRLRLRFFFRLQGNVS